jgi:hypothetical protein
MTTKQKSIIYPTLLAIILGSISCDDCVEGNNKIVTENRSSKIGSFSQIESNGAFDVYIEQSDSYEVKVEGDENILPYILTNKHGDKLVIETESEKCYSNKDAIKVYIKTKQLSYAKLNSSGIIECRKLKSDKLELVLSGSGDINFYNISIIELNATSDGSGKLLLASGSATKSILVNNGSGNLDSKGLIQQTADATINGSGYIKVYFTKSLNAKIYGSGNIYYVGNENNITLKDEGSGDIIDDH